MKLIKELMRICEDGGEIPQEFQKDAAHVNAYKQGFKHAKEGGRAIDTSRMLIPTHATAYKAGYKAGTGK